MADARVIKEIKQTGHWAWGIVRNPDLTLHEQTTGAEEHIRVSRHFRMHALKPMWMYKFLTTEAECGCLRRFGLWRVIICYDHAAADWRKK